MVKRMAVSRCRLSPEGRVDGSVDRSRLPDGTASSEASLQDRTKLRQMPLAACAADERHDV